MKYLLSLLTAATLLSACGTLPLSTIGQPTSKASTALDAASLGGLPDSQAAHPSVQLGTPAAYALSSQSRPFLQALSQVVSPMRKTLADRLKADATVSSGLAGWERSTSAQQLATLKRVAAIEAEVMGCQVPTITMQTGQSSQSGMMAYFLPGTGAGQVVLYQEAIARGGGKYMALSALVHEMRHAAQYQLVQASQSLLSSLDSDHRTLASGYAAAWAVIDALGGQETMAYGDYAHLNVEFDAFQTGNEVASRLSGGTYSALGFGFIDTHYDAKGTVSLDLLSLGQTVADASMVAAVNRAEYQAEKGHSVTQGPVRPARPSSRGFFR